ncbi:MAG: ribonucleotide reductase N-terminal alpha domain-containing protein, partial [Nitrospinota bacterium]
MNTVEKVKDFSEVMNIGATIPVQVAWQTSEGQLKPPLSEKKEGKSDVLKISQHLKPPEIKLSQNAIKVLKRRYLKKNNDGKIVETPEDMLRRVANNIAQADLLYDPNADIKETEQRFYEAMANLEFIPNSPTLMNAGRELQQLSACFVLPIGDSMEEIFAA